MSDVCDYFKLSCLLPLSGGKKSIDSGLKLWRIVQEICRNEKMETTSPQRHMVDVKMCFFFVFFHFNHKYGNNKKSNKIAHLSNAACSICV